MPPPFPVVPLPELVLADQVPAVVVVAVPTAPEGESARLAGQLPDGLEVDAPALLARETAKGTAGEVVGGERADRVGQLREQPRIADALLEQGGDEERAGGHRRPA